MRSRASAVVALMALATACGGVDGVAIGDARVGLPTGSNAALYFTATSAGAPDRLLTAQTTEAVAVEIHETTANDDGTMGMREVEGLDLPANGSLALEPGGYHLMLVDVNRMEVGDTVEVTLNWEDSGEMTIEAEVVDPADTPSDET